MTIPPEPKNPCCCKCNLGGILDRWQNITKVRPPGDTLGPNYTAIPYQRLDAAQFLVDNGVSCASIEPAGYCGVWLRGGDLNGLSAQEINDTVNDIMACAGEDADHKTFDHNCYMRMPTETAGSFTPMWTYQIISMGTTDFTTIGATTAENRVGGVFVASGAGTGTGTAKPVVDMRQYLFGAQWGFAKKFWQGTFGLKDRNDPHIITGGSCTTGRLDAGAGIWSNTFSDDAGDQPDPPQTRYLTVHSTSNISKTHISPAAATETASKERLCSVGRYTGLRAQTGSDATTYVDGSNPADVDWLNTDWNTLVGYFYGFVSGAAGPDSYVDLVAGVYRLHDAGPDDGSGLAAYDHIVEEVTPGGARKKYHWYVSDIVGGFYTWTQVTLLDESLTVSNTAAHHVRTTNFYNLSERPDPVMVESLVSDIAFSDPYTANDCNADFLKLLLADDMSDVNKQRIRQDGDFAHAALMVFDEVGPTTPDFAPLTMDDYSQPQNGDGTWPQMDWEDPNSYVWKSSSGGFAAMDVLGGNVIHRGMRTGDIISFSQAGFDSHFWFGRRRNKHIPGPAWVHDRNGGYKPVGVIPDTALRWFDDSEIYYESAANGVFSQGWWDMKGAIVRGGKFLRFPGKWPGTNVGRPCGPDKYAIDQPSVCCITAVVGSVYTVKPTGEASAPLAVGGLAVNDYSVIEADGIYKITGITDNLDGTWDVTVGAKLDDLPSGFAFRDAELYDDGEVHIGRLRWPTAPGICGRVPVTATWAAGVLTIASIDALPNLRDTIGAGISVDLHDTGYTTSIGAAALTRVDDNHWTTPMISAPAFTVAWMTAAGVDYTKYSDSPRKTAVHLEWAFDYRGVAKATPPTWYAGIAGILSCDITQFTYANSCTAVGIVPNDPDTGLPVETFPGQVMYAFPTAVTYDSYYGAHWQEEIHCTMPDPFWQKPFKPNCDGTTFSWAMDTGEGLTDDESDPLNVIRYYSHQPLVEAMSTLPVGAPALPAGVKLYFDPSNTFTPAFYSHGIPYGADTNALCDWVFAKLACETIGAMGRFYTKYSFVDCTPFA